MIEEIRYKKLGVEKKKDFEKNFDAMLDKYRSKSILEGLLGELKFVKERGKIIVYVQL